LTSAARAAVFLLGQDPRRRQKVFDQRRLIAGGNEVVAEVKAVGEALKRQARLFHNVM